VRYISNLPFASDKKLCFTLWQLKWCRKSNDCRVVEKEEPVNRSVDRRI
jgi:hypothetical protein